MAGRTQGKTLELVVYRLKDGASREQFLATNEAASRWMEQRPGFVAHELSYASEADSWIELVWWDSLEQAHTAANAAMSSESCAQMFALIDMDSALMLHGEPAVAKVEA